MTEPQDEILKTSIEIDFLTKAQEEWPLLSEHWCKMELLTPLQALLLFYDLEPLSEAMSPECIQQFYDYGDSKNIAMILNASIHNEIITLKDGYLKTKDFCLCLLRNEFSLPQVFVKFMEIHMSDSKNRSKMYLNRLKDVQSVDFNALPKHVLLSLILNSVAQIRRRKDTNNHTKTKITDVLNSPILKKIQEDFCTENDETQANIPSENTSKLSFAIAKYKKLGTSLFFHTPYHP
ncbi:MAG: hypothetical protein R3E91_05415 [Chlamydiales bacterium]